ncbi:hypothetical protein CH063_13602 [Colletotrichum higginsianum]|uniref:Uncharacterized protein n=1 Tax=Colletotrichum higginsianum (strain IMI 349063) TaxID=759273 RepID=H1VV29_COLHI|nr:hypothetical protein CH063_13602 [Colletotrichum higginsianum]
MKPKRKYSFNPRSLSRVHTKLLAGTGPSSKYERKRSTSLTRTLIPSYRAPTGGLFQVKLMFHAACPRSTMGGRMLGSTEPCCASPWRAAGVCRTASKPQRAMPLMKRPTKRPW